LDEDVQENVALKLVSGEISTDSKGLKDLQREVNKAHKLVHPNIVRTGYFWKEEGEPAFVGLEYVDGTDLHQLRFQSPNGLLAWKEVQSYMLQLCDALEYAHTQGVAHRDIKPANFMINSEGNLKLADFGIAASLANTLNTLTSMTVLGSGTPPYMSPQQLDGKRPHVTDDIYSVGATFYELLTSKPPFHQGDIGYQVRHAEVTPMVERLKELELENDFPEHVSAIVMACLHKDPAQRPQSMRVIREWIGAGEEVAQAGKVAPVAARETQKLEATPPTATTKKAATGGNRRKGTYVVAMTAIIIVALALGYWVGMSDKTSGQRTEVGPPTAPPVKVQPGSPPTGEGLPTETIKPRPNPPKVVLNSPKGAAAIETAIRKELIAAGTLQRVRHIDLSNKMITDVSALVRLKQLEILWLPFNNLTDISALEELSQLERLSLDNNPNLTIAQIEQLQRALPNCIIFHNAKK